VSERNIRFGKTRCAIGIVARTRSPRPRGGSLDFTKHLTTFWLRAAIQRPLCPFFFFFFSFASTDFFFFFFFHKISNSEKIAEEEK
jgi:hypothetical protein